MKACFWPKLRHKRYGGAGRSVSFTQQKPLYTHLSSLRIGFRARSIAALVGIGLWTSHCFSIGYLRAGVLLLLRSRQRAHTRRALSTLLLPHEFCQGNLFVTFATIPSPWSKCAGTEFFCILSFSREEFSSPLMREGIERVECDLLIPYFYTCSSFFFLLFFFLSATECARRLR